jgi:predicted CoA-binding protein
VLPVNPRLAGQKLFGQKVYAALKDIPLAIDMVDIFRNSDAVGGITEEALSLDPKPKVIWMQLGVRNDGAAVRAEAAGIKVVMNRCPAIELRREQSSRDVVLAPAKRGEEGTHRASDGEERG